MPHARVPLPDSTTLPNLMNFALEIDYFTGHDRLIFEVPEKTFFGPFALVLLASKIVRLKQACPDTTVIFDGWDNLPYLGHMGFFDMCGFTHGKEMGEASGSENYLPITKISRDHFYESEVDKYEELPDLIQRRVDRVAEIISRGKPENKNLYDVLSYSIREIFRNVFEHSEADDLFFCVQYWPKSQKVEFAVADFGIGVRMGLSGNPNFRFPSDKRALEYSLLPSVSGNVRENRMSETWFNSGYGLYMTSRLARNGGNFVIVSGLDAIHLTQSSKNNFRTSFPGTAIRMNLDIRKIGSVQERLGEFREDGKKVAAKIKGSGNRPPSAMSLLLRRDFQ